MANMQQVEVSRQEVSRKSVTKKPKVKKTAPKKTATKKAKPVAKKKVVKKAVPKKAKPVAKKAAKKTKPAAKKVASKIRAKDDLTKIEGIGPKIAQLLNDAGIFTFDELSVASVSALNKVLDDAGPRFRMHDAGSWPKQAGLAADGNWDELKKLQDRLDGGR